MAQGLYRLDYVQEEGIVITSPGKRQVFSIIPPSNDSPFTPFHYNQAGVHFQTAGTNNANFTSTQILLRIWDMMKDGTPSMNADIARLMSKGNPVGDFAHFAEMRKALVRLPHISAKITKSSWIKPNTYETEHNKLHTRLAYQESGLSPSIIINDPNYVVNIANAVIDPFIRDFSKAGIAKTYFPGAGNRVEITNAFFNFMGFSYCNLEDTQRGDGITESAHNYKLSVSPNIIIEGKNNPPLPYITPKGAGWYAGNSTKNKEFAKRNDDNLKMALLNVKELGDTLQVFLMFIAVYTIMQGMIQTMVTGDSVVFMMCIMLGLDCVYYHHLPKSQGQFHGENHVYHFNANYTLDNAKEYFRITKATIYAHNAELIARINSIKANQTHIKMTTYEILPEFHFCTRFLDAIIADMTAINAKLFELDPDNLVNERASDEENITQLNNYTFQLKIHYKIKVLFTTRKQGDGINFSGNYTKYTEKPTPQSLDQINIQQAIIINQEADIQQPEANNRANENNSNDQNRPDENDVNDENERDEVHIPNQQQDHSFIPQDGWKLIGYNRVIPFYELYTKHYATTDDCMHPTKRKNEAAKHRMMQRKEAFLRYAWERHAFGDPKFNVWPPKNENFQNVTSKSSRKRRTSNISGGVIPKNKTRHNKSPSKWDIFDLDLEQKVLYTEKTSACKDPNKPKQCTSPSHMPDSDFFPTVDIHREWLHDIILYIHKFCTKHKGAREIFNMYKQDFFREMYEYCDNYNVVLTGIALEKLAHKTLKRIIYNHTTYLHPAKTNKISIQKPITYKISPKNANVARSVILQKYLSMMKNQGRSTVPISTKRLALESKHMPAITAGGRRTRKRSKNKLHRTHKVSHTRR
jgi:heme/copper-type cytochrome/quinol oxidase subunit 4